MNILKLVNKKKKVNTNYVNQACLNVLANTLHTVIMYLYHKICTLYCAIH